MKGDKLKKMIGLMHGSSGKKPPAGPPAPNGPTGWKPPFMTGGK